MKILLIFMVFLWGILAGITTVAAIRGFYWAVAYGIFILVLTGGIMIPLFTEVWKVEGE